jgi:hypothetical protein
MPEEAVEVLAEFGVVALLEAGAVEFIGCRVTPAWAQLCLQTE